MPRDNPRDAAIPGEVRDVVARLGANVAGARLRRRWSQEMLAERAGISRATLARLEAGEPGTGIGVYVAVLWAMGLHGQLTDTASLLHDDEGRTLEEARLPKRAHQRRSLLSDDF